MAKNMYTQTGTIATESKDGAVKINVTIKAKSESPEFAKIVKANLEKAIVEAIG